MAQATMELRASGIERDGIVDAIGVLEGRNRIGAAFYDGPSWPKFRPWERMFLALQGGEQRARSQILKHLPAGNQLRVLEVGIGDGDNLPFLPASWEIHGVDFARTRLENSFRRFPSLNGRLAWAQAEELPYEDGSFDAAYCIGGFNFFGDHAQAIREMRRVTRPGGTIVVADEVTWLHRCGLGHLIGIPAIDAVWLRWLGLDREFIKMVFETRLNIKQFVAENWREAKCTRIWGGLGYCLVES